MSDTPQLPPTPKQVAANLYVVVEQLAGLTGEIIASPSDINASANDVRLIVRALRLLSDTSSHLSAECTKLANAAEQSVNARLDLDSHNLN